MKSYRKSSLAVAVSAAIGAIAVVPVAHSFSIDVSGSGEILADSRGDSLLFPIYTTAVGAQTSLSTTNTGGSTIAAKIRFREQEHSMDVLDFIVIYSPYDKFDFSVSQGPGETRPVMRWNDTSCVIGPDAGGAQAFPAPSTFVADNEVMQVGHVEMLGMANLDDICWNGTTRTAAEAGANRSCDDGFVNLGAAGEHGDNGEPANCSLLVNVLGNPAHVMAINDAFSLNASVAVTNGSTGAYGYDVENDLLGRYVITDAAGGIEAGGDAIAIQNSNFILSAQSPTECSVNEPVNCWQGYEWDAREFDHPHFGDMANLEDFQRLLSAAAIAGDWSNNPANFVGVDWIISFPSKYAYLGYDNADCGEGDEFNDVFCLLSETRPQQEDPWDHRPGHASVWVSGDPTTDLCLSDVDLAVYDSEENEASGNVTVSPGAETELDICPELGVYTLSPIDGTPRESVIQTTERRKTISFQNLDALRGWAQIGFTWGTSGAGAAVNALNFTTRATANPEFNNGSLTTLQKFDFDGRVR